MDDPFEIKALDLLCQLTGDKQSSFRSSQIEAIKRLVKQRQRVLLVQRTGWGKSAVYFIATRMLRDSGAGPTLLISPLLALMRNQIEAAARMGIQAETVNSSGSQEDWEEVRERIRSDQVDILLVSPERLSNTWFQREILPALGKRSGLLVVDEAHCISDWGHDFRPDYRKITDILNQLTPAIPVLCCTATANDRVVNDVMEQIGRNTHLVRGPLGRDGLGLHVLNIPKKAERLVWLSEMIPRFEGTGIVYCLTINDTHQVAGGLKKNGVSAVAYSSRLEAREREKVEKQLLDNDVKVVVATSALGMGFDKPDLSFVVHFQAPSSPIAYYQQIGRAGRSLFESNGVLLRGEEDGEIQDFFIQNAFPNPELAEQVVSGLAETGDWWSLPRLEGQFNAPRKSLLHLMTVLTIERAVESDGQKWRGIPNRWEYDHDRAERVTALRYEEQREMASYANTATCRMSFLRQSLDDLQASDCGYCDNCAAASLPKSFEYQKVASANGYLRHQHSKIQPRKRWPGGPIIPSAERLQIGVVLSKWGDGGWGSLVKRGKQVEGCFDQKLVDASAEMISTSGLLHNNSAWVCCVPSLRSPNLVPDFAQRLAHALNLEFCEVVEKTRETFPQKTMENSAQQYSNIRGVFTISGSVPDGPVLLVDDIVDSRWTLTEIGHRLLRAGSGPVFPVALASTAMGS